MCRIPVAAVLCASVQVICVNRESAAGARLPGVRRKARRFQAKLLTEPRLGLYPPKPGLLPGQVHGPSEHAGSGRVREHVCTSALWLSLPPSVRRIRRTKSCVSNLALSSTSIGHASVSRAPKLVHFGWGVLLLHAGQRHFRAPTCTRCRRTSMQTGVANRLALLPLLR